MAAAHDVMRSSTFGGVLDASAPYPYSYWGTLTVDALQPPRKVRPGGGNASRASSVHTSGMVAAMADGSVRTTPFSVSP